MYLFVPCDKKSHGTEISFPIRSSPRYLTFNKTLFIYCNAYVRPETRAKNGLSIF